MVVRFLPRRFLLLVVVLLAVLGVGAARAESVEKPALLVASAVLDPTGYRQTVLLVIPAGNGQHFGFILNRPTDASLHMLFPEHAPSRKVKDPVYFGGPMLAQALFAVVRAAESPTQNAIQVLPNLFVVTRSESVDQVIEERPNEARYFVGFVGWRPGELDSELARGMWSVQEADVEAVFRKDPKTLWNGLSKPGSAPQGSGKRGVGI